MNRTLIFSAAVALTSCSIQVDSQYGLRLGSPAVRSHNAPHEADANPEALAVESSPSPLAPWSEAHNPWATDDAPISMAIDAPIGSDAGVDHEAIHNGITEAQGKELIQSPGEHVDAGTQISSAQNSIPYWLEVTLGILGVLVGFGLIILGGIGAFLSVFAMGWGEVAVGVIGLLISLVVLVGGWLLVRYLQNNVLVFNAGDMFSGGGRLMNVILGTAAIVLAILLSM
ncbi:MAG: hypothetical protein ACO204_03120 [Schleiferiaceae bacterium]